MSKTTVFQKILLKLSGESLQGNQPYGIDPAAAAETAARLKAICETTQVAVVIGAGNIFRGAFAKGIPRATADHMGMLATIMNALALQAALENVGVEAVVQTPGGQPGVTECFDRRQAQAALDRGAVVIFGGGTGCPFLTTDTAAALRANEIGADALFKATQVDGVYDDDPKTNPDARRYETLTFSQALQDELKVMDAAAFSLCRDQQLPIVVFKWADAEGVCPRLLQGDRSVGTIVSP